MATRFLTQVSRILRTLSPIAILALSIQVAYPQPAQPPSTPAQEKLLSIVQRHEKLLFQYAEDPAKFEEKELEQRIDTIAKAYAAFNKNNPKDVFGYVLHGKFLREIGRYKDAYAIFLKAYELDPNLAIVNQQLGNHHAENGRFKEAYQHYAKAAKLDPTVPIYHFQLGAHLIYYAKPLLAENVLSPESFDKTLLSSLAEAVRLAPNNRSYKQLQAEAYYDLNKPDWEAALQSWTQLLVPGIPDSEEQAIQLHRAKVLHHLGRTPEARLLLPEITQPSLSESKKQLIDQLDGAIAITAKPDIPKVPDASRNKVDLAPPPTDAVNQNLILEIAALRKELEILKSTAPKPVPVKVPAPPPADKEELAGLQKQLESANQKAEALQKQLAGTKETLAHKEKTLSSFEKNLKTYAATNSDLYKQLQDTQKKSRELQQKLANMPPPPPPGLAKEKENLEAELAKEKAKAETLAKEAGSYKQQAEKLLAQTKANEAQYKTELASVRKSLETAIAAHTQDKSQGEATASQLAKTKQDLAAKTTELEKLRNNSEKLAAELDLKSKLNLNHQSKAGEFEKQNAALAKQLADAQAAHKDEFAKLQSSLQQAMAGKTQGEALAGELAKAKQALLAKDTEVAKLAKTLEDQGKDAKSLQGKADTLAKQLADAQAAHKDELSTLQKRLEETMKAGETQKAKGSETETQLAQIQKELSLGKAELAKAMQQAEIFKKANADLFDSQKQIKVELAESKTVNTLLKEKLDEVLAGSTQLDTMLAKKTKEIDIHLQSLDTLRKQQERTKGLLDAKDAALTQAKEDARLTSDADSVRIAKLTAEREGLAKDLDTVKAVHAADIAKLKESLAAAMDKDGNASKILAAKEAELRKLQESHASLGKQLAESKSAHSKEVAGLKETLETAMKSGEKGKALLAEVEKAKAELGKAQSTIEAKEKELADLGKTSETRATELASIREKLKALGEDMSGKAQLAKAQHERIRSLETQNTALDSQIVRLQKSLADAMKSGEEGKALLAEVDKAKAALAAKDGELAKAGEEAEELTKAKDALSKQLADSKAAHAAEITKMQQNLATAMKSGEDGKALLAELEKAKAAIETLSTELEETKSDATGLAKSLETAKEETGKAQATAKEKAGQLEDLEAQKAELASKVDDLGKKLDSAMKAGEGQLEQNKGVAEELAKTKEALAQKEAALATAQESLSLANKAKDDLAEATKAAKASQDEALASKKAMAAQLEKLEKASLVLNAELAAKVEELKKQEQAYKELAAQSSKDRDELANSLQADLDKARKALAEKEKALEALGKEATGSLEEKEAELAKLNEQNKTLKTEFKSAQKVHELELADLLKQMKEAAKANDVQMAKGTEALKNLANAEKALEAKDSELVKLKAEAAANSSLLETARKQVVTLTKELTEKGEASNGLAEKAKEMENANATLAKQLKETEEAAAAKMEELQNQLAGIQEAMESSKGQQADTASQLEDAKQALAQKEAALAAAELKMEVFTKANNDLFEANKQSKSTLGSAQGTIQSLQDQIATQEKAALILNAVLAEKIEALKAFDGEKAEMSEKLTQAQGKLELASQAKNGMETKVATLEAELEKARKDTASQADALAKLKSEISTATEESGKAMQTLENLNKELLAKLDTQKKDHLAEVALLKKAQEEAMAAGAKHTTEHQQALAKAEAAEKALASQEGELEKLKVQLGASKLEIIKMSEALANAGTKEDALAAKEVEIEKLKTELGAAKLEIAKGTEALAQAQAKEKGLAAKEAELEKLRAETEEAASGMAKQMKALESVNAELINRIDSQQNAHKAELEELKQAHGEAMAAGTKSSVQNEEALAKAAEAQKQAKEAQRTLAAKEAELAKANVKAATLTKALEDSKKEAEKLSAAMDGQGKEALAHIEKAKTLEEQNAALLKQIQNGKQTHTAEIATLQESLKKAQEQLLNAPKPATPDKEMAARLQKATQDLATSNLQLTARQEEINALKSTNSLLNSQIQQMRDNQGKQSDKEKEVLVEQVAVANQKNASLQGELKKQFQEIRFLNSELTLFEDNLLKLLNAERQSKEEISTLKKSLEQANETITTLQKPAPEPVPGEVAPNSLLQEELNRQAGLVKLKEKQLAELRAAQSTQAAAARAAQESLKGTVNKLGNQLNTLNQEKANLDKQLSESQATIASLEKKLAGNPYANLPSAPLTSLADDNLQVKLELAQADQAELRKRLDQTNKQKINVSEKLVVAENNFKRIQEQLLDAKGRIKALETSTADTATRDRLKKVEEAFATYRQNAQTQLATLEPLRKELEELKNRPAPAPVAKPASDSDKEAALLRSRLVALVESSTKAKEALTEVHSALIQANKTNTTLEAEMIRLKHDNQKLGIQLQSLAKLPVAAPATPAPSVGESAQVRKLQIELQQAQTKLDERERQFENVVKRMNTLIARLKQPQP